MNTKLERLSNGYTQLAQAFHEMCKLSSKHLEMDRHKAERFEECKELVCKGHIEYIKRVNE